MAIENNHSIALHLRSPFDDALYVDGFRHAGMQVRTVNLLADVIVALNALATTPALFAIAPAQHGGITLLDLLNETPALSHVKVVLIDPESDVYTAIRALRLGVSDYFSGGMMESEIHARIHALLHCRTRTTAALQPSTAIMAALATPPFESPSLSDDVSINNRLHAIRKGDMWVSLSPIEWRVFEELIHNRGRVVPFSELVRRALRRERVTPSETSLLRLHMSRLRAKLNAHFDHELHIITMRGRGYMLT